MLVIDISSVSVADKQTHQMQQSAACSDENVLMWLILQIFYALFQCLILICT